MLADPDPFERSLLPAGQHADGSTHLPAVHALSAGPAESGRPAAGRPELGLHRRVAHLRPEHLREQQTARLQRRSAQLDRVALRRADHAAADQPQSRVSGVVATLFRGRRQSRYRESRSVRPAHVHAPRAQPHRRPVAGPQPQLGRRAALPDLPAHRQRHLAARQLQRIPSQSPRVSSFHSIPQFQLFIFSS